MKKSFLGKLSLTLSLALTLTACGGGAGGNKAANEDKKDSGAVLSEIEKKHPVLVENEGKAIEGGTLKVGIVSDSPFKGIFNGFLYDDGIDDAFMRYTMNGAFPLGKDFKLILDSDETPIKVTIDEANKTVNYKINPKFKWSNGEQVTTKDIVRTYEIVANNEYIMAAKSVRYGDDMKVIEGIEDYNTGKAKTISGLEVIDDSNMKIHLKEMTPGVFWGGPFVSEFVNAKQLEGIAMDKIQESDAIRKNPLSYGPYVIKSIVQGERVIFEANKNYYKGEPKIKNVEIEILPTSQQVAAIKAGKYDLVYQLSGDAFPEIEALENVKTPARMELYMSYLGFKTGKWDSAKNENVYDPNAKMSDVALRKAMGHAIDNDALGEKFYYGLRFRAVSPIAPVFKTLHDPEIKGVPFDMEKAKSLLEEAGYKDTNNDGIREGKDGKPFSINFAMMSGGEIQEPLSQYYIQQWKDIGLDVKLVDGRLLDLHNFYDRVKADDPAIDVFSAAFGLASDPNPVGLYGKGAAFNYSRYTSEKLQTALDKLNSAEAMDPANQEKLYHEFEKVFEDEAPSVPLMNRVEYIVVNNRVKKYDFNQDEQEAKGFDWSQIELTADAPIASK